MQKNVFFITSILVLTLLFSGCVKKDGSQSGSQTTKGSSVPVCQENNYPESIVAVDSEKTFGENNDVFSLKYPSSWEIFENGNHIQWYSPNEQSPSTTVAFAATYTPELPTDIEIYMKGLATGFEVYENYKIVENCSTTIAGLPARKLIWTGDQAQYTDVKSVHYVFKKSDNEYMLMSFVASSKYFDSYIGAVEEMVKSIVIK